MNQDDMVKGMMKLLTDIMPDRVTRLERLTTELIKAGFGELITAEGEPNPTDIKRLVNLAGAIEEEMIIATTEPKTTTEVFEIFVQTYGLSKEIVIALAETLPAEHWPRSSTDPIQ